MTTDRRAEMLKRGGIDPIRLDHRPLSVIMGDAVPYDKFERQWALIQRLGYKDHQEFLRYVNERKHSKRTDRGSV